MPTKRTLRTRNRIPEATPLELWLAADGLLPYPKGASPAEKYFLGGTPEQRRAIWEKCRARVLKLWTKKRPGECPALWWEFDAVNGDKTDGQ